jgi:hypothetical protein
MHSENPNDFSLLAKISIGNIILFAKQHEQRNDHLVVSIPGLP